MTTRLYRSTALLIGLVLVLLAPAAGWAQGLEDGAPTMAEQRYQLARTLYREGKLEQALNEFKSARDLFPKSVKLAFNIARVAERLGKLDVAAEHYRAYLELAPEADDADEVKRLIASLESRVKSSQPELVVSTSPAGAKVFIDVDKAPRGVTPLRVRLAPGTHAARIELDGYKPALESVKVQKGRVAAITVQLEKIESAAPVAAVATPAEPPAEASGGWHRTAGWVAVGVGGALMAYGGYSALQASDLASNSTLARGDREGYDALQSDLDSHNLQMGIGLGIGAAVALTGGALLLFYDGDESQARVSPTGHGAMVEVLF